MELQKLAVKIFSQEGTPVPLASFIDVFHGWIQESDGIYHDVADYSHMRDGAGIVLVARNQNVSIDETGGRRGLLYKQKTLLRGSNAEKLRQVFLWVLEYCRRIEKDPLVAKRIVFPATEAEVSIADRLTAPNTEDAFAQLTAEVENFVAASFNQRVISLERKKGPRQCLGLTFRVSRPLDLAFLARGRRPGETAGI
jgi:hypothetical protein